MNISKPVMFASLLFTLSACAVANVQQYGTIDPNDKTVTVHTGGGGLNGQLKGILNSRGFKLVVDSGPKVTEGTMGEKTKLVSYETLRTRYRLQVHTLPTDMCITGDPYIIYDVSLVDNQSGSEVFTINGRGCESGAVDAFKSAIESKPEKF